MADLSYMAELFDLDGFEGGKIANSGFGDCFGNHQPQLDRGYRCNRLDAFVADAASGRDLLPPGVHKSIDVKFPDSFPLPNLLLEDNPVQCLRRIRFQRQLNSRSRGTTRGRFVTPADRISELGNDVSLAVAPPNRFQAIRIHVRLP